MWALHLRGQGQAIQLDRTTGEGEFACQSFEQCGFARTIGADYSNEFSRLQIEVQLTEHGTVAAFDGNIIAA